ncbi:MAG: hypothetical protein ACQEXN_15170 [Actinomycetota bacterium]
MVPERADEHDHEPDHGTHRLRAVGFRRPAARTRIGTSSDGQTITWHTGETGGYSSYFGRDRTHNKAVIVLSDVVTAATVALGSNPQAANG